MRTRVFVLLFSVIAFGGLAGTFCRADDVPVGSIVAFFGKDSDLAGTDWVVCNAANHVTYGAVVPDLTNRFLEGVGNEALGAVGGSNSPYTPQGAVNVTGSANVIVSVSRAGPSGNGFDYGRVDYLGAGSGDTVNLGGQGAPIGLFCYAAVSS
jgi:hypothetical protein